MPTGHVPRNMRVSLVGVDSVQPYVCLSKRVNVKKARANRRERKDHDRLLLSDKLSEYELKVKWYVGGAFSVDSSHLSWHAPALSWNTLFEHRADWSSVLNRIRFNEGIGIISRTTLEGADGGPSLTPLIRAPFPG
jgi:hypothetical protein